MMAKFRLQFTTALSIFLGILGLAYAQTAGKPALITEIGNRACILRADNENADITLNQMGVRLSGADATTKNAVASALHTLAVRSNQGLGQTFKGLQIDITNNLSSQYTGSRGGPGVAIAGLATRNQIRLDRSLLNQGGLQSNKAIAEGTVIHELGHVVARRKNLQSKYDSQVEHCPLTGYCTHMIAQNGAAGQAHGHRREEFAEIFSAYILAADTLKSQCPSAYAFMKKEVFNNQEGNTSTACTPTAPARTMLTSGGQRVNLPSGEAPAGYTAETSMGFDLQGLEQWVSVAALAAMEQKKEQEAREALLKQQQMRQQYNPQNVITPSGGGGASPVNRMHQF